jgi:hypothetical protein
LVGVFAARTVLLLDESGRAVRLGVALNFKDKYNLKDLLVTLKTPRGGILFRLKKTL